MMDNVLNVSDRFEERKFIITSIIRMMALLDFEENTILNMYLASKKLKEIETVDGIITDDTLFKWFDKGGELL